MDNLIRIHAEQELVKQGMTMKQAKHEVDFNEELYMKVRVMYGLGLKENYLYSTDEILNDLFSIVTGTPITNTIDLLKKNKLSAFYQGD